MRYYFGLASKSHISIGCLSLSSVIFSFFQREKIMGAKLVSTTMRLSLILALQSFLINDCHGCLCKVVPNFSCPPPPHCCESGMYTYDECGCCLTCAKSELQPCGGPNGVGGKCAKGLSCLKTCSNARYFNGCHKRYILGIRYVFRPLQNDRVRG